MRINGRYVGEIPHCIHHLMTFDGGDQVSGLKEILYYGEFAFESLIATLEGDSVNDPTWEYIAIALVLIDQERALPYLLRALQDRSNPRRQRDMAQKLASMRIPDAEPLLIDLLDTDDTQLYQSIVFALAELQYDHAFELLLPLLDDSNSIVKGNAILALGLTEDARAFEIILPYLQAEQRWIHSAALEGLAYTHDSRAYNLLIEWPNNTDDTVDVIDALGRLHDERAVPLLRPFIDGSEFENRFAIQALGNIGGQAAAEILITYFQNGSNSFETRTPVGGAVLWTGYAPGTDLVFDYPDMNLLFGAVVNAVDVGNSYRLPYERIIALLSEVLRTNPNRSVRSSALHRLNALYDPRSVPALQVALKDEDQHIRWDAGDALVRLGVRDWYDISAS